MRFSNIISIIIAFLYSLMMHGQNDISADLQKLDKFLRSIDQKYVDSVETYDIVEHGIQRMLEDLDPHSVYMNPEQYQRANEPLSGRYKGIGIRYRVIEDTLTVVEVIENSPADKGGLQFGDQLIAVGSDTLSGKNLSANAMSKRIKDEKNTDQPFDILRSGEPLSTILTRDNVPVSSIASAIMLDEKTGYIKLTRFSSSSVSDFRQALDKLDKLGMKSLVFDLRGNSGGYLNAAIKIVDEFLEDRKLIVYTEGLHQSKKETFANSGGRFTNGDLVVLIDERSASASEIVAGAIQDWDRGLIVGRRSYGKGLVQRTIDYDDGSAMRLTISRYYTPTGRSIQKPYDKGLKAYKSDLKKRKLSGELLNKDSIKVNDTLVYYTPRKRKVYGGGGIIPDRFIAADTTKMHDLSKELYKKGLPYYFAIRLVQANRKDILDQHTTIEKFTNDYSISQDWLNAFKRMAVHRQINVEDDEFELAKQELTADVKEIMARYLYGYEDHYYIIAKSDLATMKAIELLNDNTFKELGLNAN